MTWEEIVQDPIVVGVAAAVIAVIVVALIVWLVVRRRRSERLQRRFGAEYKRTVDASGSRRQAEQDLGQRRERRDRMQVRPLTATEREDFRARFEEIQASFVDGPESAVRFAHRLLEEVAELRGYEAAEGGPLAGVSVDHPEDTAVHRRRISMLDSDGRLDTEDLRQAMLSARRLLERLAREGEDAQAPAPAPPRSLLGLDASEEDEEDETAAANDEPGRDGSDTTSGAGRGQSSEVLGLDEGAERERGERERGERERGEHERGERERGEHERTGADAEDQRPSTTHDRAETRHEGADAIDVTEPETTTPSARRNP